MPRLLSHGFFPHPPAGPSPVCRRTRGTGYTIPGGALFLSLQPLFPPVARTFPPVRQRTGGAGHAPSDGALSFPYGPLSSNCRQSPLSRPPKGRGAGNALSRAPRLLSCSTLPPPAARAFHPPIEGGGTQGTPSRALRFRLLLPASFSICRRVLSPRPPYGAERDQSPTAVFRTGQGPFSASPPLF